MKLLYITPYYKPAWYFGGPPRCISEQAELLHQELSWEIDVITLNLNGNLPLFEDSDIVVKNVEGIKVFYLPHRFTPFYNYFYSEKLKEFQNVIQYYDVVHIHGVFNAFSKIACQMALKAGVPFILTPHGMLDRWSLQKSRGIKWLHHLLFESKLVRNAARVHLTTVSEKLNSRLPASAKTIVIPYLIQFICKQDFHQRLSEISNKVRMIFIGRINRKKGILQFIEAISKLQEYEKERLIFDLYGNNEENHLQAVQHAIEKYQLQNIVTYKGFLLPEERKMILKQYDVMVLTCFQENFGITVLESLEENIPVFISDQVNVLDWIKKYDCGWITSMKTETIAETMKDILLQSPEQIANKGINSQKLFEKEININTLLQEYKKMYESVVIG